MPPGVSHILSIRPCEAKNSLKREFTHPKGETHSREFQRAGHSEEEAAGVPPPTVPRAFRPSAVGRERHQTNDYVVESSLLLHDLEPIPRTDAYGR